MIPLSEVEWGPTDADKRDPLFISKWIEPENIRELMEDRVWMITGEKGSGKTAICRAIKEKHAKEFLAIAEVNFDK
jgi:polynucleotide 5'-kinase involved in rRNA processing